jgi:hypothetical protein
MKLPGSGPGEPGGTGGLFGLLGGEPSRKRIWVRRIFTAIAAGLLVWDPFSIGRSGNGSFALLMTSTLQGYRARLDDPRFPSGRTLSAAGLSLLDGKPLDLPRADRSVGSDGEARQVLGGNRHGREVRSGIHCLRDGRTLIRTGITSRPPCFSCRVVEGHLLSTNAPMAMDRKLLTSRTGPGRLSVVNDGSWLVLERVLSQGYCDRRAMLLLRQLRDITLAEKMAAGLLTRRKAAFV